MKRVALISAIALTLVGAVLAQAFRSDGAAERGQQGKHAYQARGVAEGLYPGFAKDLRVAVNNRTSKAVVLRSIKLLVKRGNPGCGKRFLGAPGARGVKKMIPRRSKRGVTLRVKMRRSAPDACQGAKFPIKYRVRFRRPRG